VCEEVSAEAEVAPLDVVLVLDRSGSMETEGLWQPFTQAISDFITHPDSDGLTVGINFFPQAGVNDCPAGYGACYEGLYGYNGTLQVDFETLPAGESALLTALGNETAQGTCTPTFGALKGSLRFAMDYQDANPTRKVIVVVASDGAPNGCPSVPVDGNDPDAIADLASNAFYYNGVLTFAIAIDGANVADLDKIAAAGGTTVAFDITGDISAFVQEMQNIQGTVLSCEFLIPDVGDGDFDPGKVNVVYTPGDGSPPETIPQAPTPADCGDESGWFYDNPANPTKISLCPGICDVVQADNMAQVNVAFGCPTIIK